VQSLAITFSFELNTVHLVKKSQQYGVVNERSHKENGKKR